MTPQPVEQQIREVGELARGDGRIPPGLADKVRRHRRRRQFLAAAAVPTVIAGVTFSVLIPSHVLVIRHGDQHAKAGGRHHATNPSVAPPTSPSPVHFTALPAINATTSAGEPRSMLVSLGAGNERLARVATDSGTVTHWLQTNGSQMLMTFTADSSVAYQPTPDGCGSTWTAINTTTGASRPAFETLGRPAEVAVASDNTRIAYVDVGPQERVPHGRGGTMPAGCPTAPHALVVSDPASGATATYPIANYDLSLYPAFDSRGTRLAFVWHRQVRILDLNHDTALNDATPLSSEQRRGCTQTKPVWKPGTSTVLVAEQCGQTPAIVGYDAGSGEQTYRHPVAGPALIGSFAVDNSGEHLVYSSSRLDGPGSSIFAVEPAGDRHIIDDGYQVGW